MRFSIPRYLAAFALAAACSVVIGLAFVGDASAATHHLPYVSGDAGLVVANALLALRSKFGDLQTRATAKLAEVKDGMSPEAVRTIETDHAELVRQANAAQAEITAEETRIAALPPAVDLTRAHAWTGEDIGRVTARAVAFGLTAVDATAIMADPAVRSLEAATDKLQAKAAANNSTRQQPHVTITRDAGDTIRQAVEASIVLRANPRGLADKDPARELARQYRGMSLMEVGRVFTEETSGVKLRGLDKREMASVLLGLDTRAGMHSTSDFANLLANVASKRLRNAYEVAPQNWKKIGRQSNNPDFKEKSVVQLSSAPTFKKVREGGEFTYGGLTDGVEKYALATYGRIIAITRQTLINDDLGAFDRLPAMLGRQAAELEATTFWSVLTANAAMGDGTVLFHADHGNLLDASAINEAGLKAAKSGMRKQKALAVKAADREPLNLIPIYLVVGPDKEVEAQKMLTSVLSTVAADVNVFAGSMELIVEPRLTGNAWFTVADPALVDTVEYAYLEGEEGVFTEQRIGFQVDGIEVKGRLDFAAKAIDWRGMNYNPGA
jgi:hypothetical protein